MNWTTSLPQDQVFWYVSRPASPPLTHDITVDVVVIGGGMAGLSAAQSFQEAGLRVALLERNFCGSGASGKSSGFITPDSELSLATLMERTGPARAQQLWDFINTGVHRIRDNINTYALECDYQLQDTLVVATSDRAWRTDIQKEHDIRQKLGYPTTLHERSQVPQLVGSTTYQGAITYPDTFGIHAYSYCQGMKEVLAQKGVSIYEDTPVTQVFNDFVQTPGGCVHAKHIVICADQYAAGLPSMAEQVYHAQTFLLISQPLTDAQTQVLFPNKRYMVWDTDQVYHYYRVTGQQRLLVGGSTLWDTFAPHEKHDHRAIVAQLTSYMKTRFPALNPVWHYSWPGLIGISKDLMPLAGPDRDMPRVYYISGATGLPWAAALGNYSARHILEQYTLFDDLFNPYRTHRIGPIAQKILGKRFSFALENFLTTDSV